MAFRGAGNGLTNQELGHVCEMPNLKKLVLTAPNIRGSRGVVQGLEKLEVLECYRGGLTVEFLQSLKHLPNLRTVFIGEQRLTEDMVAALAEIATLKDLTLYHCRLPWRGGENLERLVQLEALTLDKSVYNEAAVVKIGKLTGLKSLWLERGSGYDWDHFSLTPETIGALPASVRELGIINFSISSDTLAKIAERPLDVLSLACSRFDNIDALRNHPSIKGLNLNHAHLNGAYGQDRNQLFARVSDAVSTLATIPNLETLSISLIDQASSCDNWIGDFTPLALHEKIKLILGYENRSNRGLLREVARRWHSCGVTVEGLAAVVDRIEANRRNLVGDGQEPTEKAG